MCLIDRGFPVMIDSIATCALAVNQNSVLRVIRGGTFASPSFGLLIYDELGLARTLRLDARVRDCHGIGIFGARILLSTRTSIMSLNLSDLSTETYWSAPGGWQIRGMAVGATAVTLLIVLTDHSSSANTMGAQLVHLPDDTREDCLLESPTVISSGGRSLIVASDCSIFVYERTRGSKRVASIPGTPLSLAVDFDRIYVGVAEGTGAAGLIMELSACESPRSVAKPPIRTDILAVCPTQLAKGLTIGRRTNITRVQQEDQLNRFRVRGITPSRLWAMSPVPTLSALRARFAVKVPDVIRPSSRFFVVCTVSNEGDAILSSASPNPVEFYYKWARGGVGVLTPSYRTPLPRPLPPRESLTSNVLVVAPETSGEYNLLISLFQEGLGAFPEFDSESHCTIKLHVVDPEDDP